MSPRTVFGQVQRVKAIYPLETKPVEKTTKTEAESEVSPNPQHIPRTDSKAGEQTEEEKRELWDPPVLLTHLTPAQQLKVKKNVKRRKWGILQR